MSFAHLHVHTDYSVDSIARIPELFARARDLDIKGLAITDHGTMGGVLRFLHVAKDFPTVKPVVGCECWLKHEGGRYHLILLAKNLTGYRHLVKLISEATMDSNDSRKRITHEMLEKYHEGLICSSACIGGEIPQAILAGDLPKARELALWYKHLFGEDFYLEVSLHKGAGDVALSPADNEEAYGRSNRELVAKQEAANEGIFRLGAELGIKVIATNDVHFVAREDGIRHDVFLASQHERSVGNPRRIRYSHLEYLKDEAEMKAIFPDHPEAIANTMDVLDKIERYDVRRPIAFPHISDNPVEELKAAAQASAEKRYPAEELAAVRELIDWEVGHLERKGACAYFLIVKEIVDWARSQGIAVGPGRNTAPSSMVCYCLGITDIDPKAFHLLPERFIQPGNDSLPRINLEFDAARREEVSGHLKDKYGADSVAELASYLTLPPHKAERMSEKGLADVIYNSVIDANSVLLSDGPMNDYLPLEVYEGLTPVAEYDGRDSWIDETGVLRMNFLSLTVLDEMKETVRLIKERTGVEVNLDEVNLQDEKTLDVFRAGDTREIFQFGADGLRDWLRQFRPNSIHELCILNAMYRPELMEGFPLLCENRTHPDRIDYGIPEMKEFLGDTFGLAIYQEQLMMIGRWAGLPPEKERAFMKLVVTGNERYAGLKKEEFIELGALHRHIDRPSMERLWDKLSRESRLAMPKAHIVSYTTLAFKCAWLKAHYLSVKNTADSGTIVEVV